MGEEGERFLDPVELLFVSFGGDKVRQRRRRGGVRAEDNGGSGDGDGGGDGVLPVVVVVCGGGVCGRRPPFLPYFFLGLKMGI